MLRLRRLEEREYYSTGGTAQARKSARRGIDRAQPYFLDVNGQPGIGQMDMQTATVGVVGGIGLKDAYGARGEVVR
ncbi:MAG: hypothetical protein WBI91_00005, partial [Coriobacteriia bacterium]